MTYVIVGAGPAGVIAAETLRKQDPSGEIVMINGEQEPPYSRMAIPYFLIGKVKQEGTYLRKTEGHYDNLKITEVKGRIESISPKQGVVNLEGGKTQSYDKLLLTTGASPIKPPIQGLDLPGVHHCWTLEDARAIEGLAAKGANVVLMGAGFIGCIILESLMLRGVNLTVVEMGDRMVPRMMNQTAGGMIKRWCEEKGADVHTSTRVTKVEKAAAGGAGSLSIELENGHHVEADLLVVAAGVRPNIGFVEGSGILTGDGILVDDHLKTTVDNIYAAGDCAEGMDYSTGGPAIHAIQTTAVDQARIAALNMSSHPRPYPGSLSMNVLDTLGLISVSFGLWQGVDRGDHVESVNEAAYKYIRLEFEHDQLIGAITIGRTDHVGVLRGLIEGKFQLGQWKEKLMKDPHQIMEAYLAVAQAQVPA